MSLKLDEEDMKEATEFLTRLGGSFTSVVEQMFFDWLATANPSMQSSPLFQRLTPEMQQYSDFLVSLGLNVAPWVVALLGEQDASKRGNSKDEAIVRGVRQFMEGGVLYTVPRLVRIPEVHVASST